MLLSNSSAQSLSSSRYWLILLFQVEFHVCTAYQSHSSFGISSSLVFYFTADVVQKTILVAQESKSLFLFRTLNGAFWDGFAVDVFAVGCWGFFFVCQRDSVSYSVRVLLASWIYGQGSRPVILSLLGCPFKLMKY